MRWHHPGRGLLLPGLPAPASTTPGSNVHSPTASWSCPWPLPPAGGRPARSRSRSTSRAANVTDLELPAKLAAAARRHALPLRALTLELIEHTLMADPGGPARCWPNCAPWAWGCPSTTTARAIAPWPTCVTCPPTSSSSTGPSPPTSTATRTPRQSCGTPSRSPTNSGCGWWPRASRRRDGRDALAALGCDVGQGYAHRPAHADRGVPAVAGDAPTGADPRLIRPAAGRPRSPPDRGGRGRTRSRTCR